MLPVKGQTANTQDLGGRWSLSCLLNFAPWWRADTNTNSDQMDVSTLQSNLTCKNRLGQNNIYIDNISMFIILKKNVLASKMTEVLPGCLPGATYLNWVRLQSSTNWMVYKPKNFFLWSWRLEAQE